MSWRCPRGATRRQLVRGLLWLLGAALSLPALAFAGRSRAAAAGAGGASSGPPSEQGRPDHHAIDVQACGAAGDGVMDDTGAIRAAFAACRDGSTIVFPPGVYRVTGQTLIDRRRRLAVSGHGATLLLDSRPAWGSADNLRSVLAFQDCQEITVEGLRFDGNGAVLGPVVRGPFGMLSVISNQPPQSGRHGDVRFIASSEHVVIRHCVFRDVPYHALQLRLVNHVTIENCQFVNGYKESFVAMARCDYVTVRHNKFIGGETLKDQFVPMVGLSPGHLGGDKWNVEMAINACQVINYDHPLDLTAPRGKAEWTFSYAGANTTVGIEEVDPDRTDWFFTCHDPNGAEDVHSAEIIAVGGDRSARTMTVRRFDRTGQRQPRDFNGQKFFATGLRLDRFCKFSLFEGNEFYDTAGVGLFILGCRDFIINGNIGDRCGDYVLDAEWCMSGMFSNNMCGVTGRHRNYALGLLFFIRDVTVVGNTVRMEPGNGAIHFWNNGQNCAGIVVANNLLHGGGVAMIHVDGSRPGNIYESVTVTNNQFLSSPYGVKVMAGENAGTVKNLLISGNIFQGMLEDPIILRGIDGALIHNNLAAHTRHRGLVIDLPRRGGASDSRNVVIDGNAIRDMGQASPGSMAVYAFGGTGEATQFQIGQTHFLDHDVDVPVETRPVLTMDGSTRLVPHGPRQIRIGTASLRYGQGTLQVSEDATGCGGGDGNWTLLATR